MRLYQVIIEKVQKRGKNRKKKKQHGIIGIIYANYIYRILNKNGLQLINIFKCKVFYISGGVTMVLEKSFVFGDLQFDDL